jgi:HEAT repeat protein
MLGPVHILATLMALCCLTLASGCAEITDSLRSAGQVLSLKKTPEQELGIKTPKDRIKELKQLSKAIGDEPPGEQQRIVDVLTRELSAERDPIVRRHILRTIAACPPASAEAVLIGAMADPDAETRRTICVCLGQRGGKASIQELARVLSSETNGAVRIAAVKALGQTKDTGAMMPLVEVMAESDPALKNRARESLSAVSGRDYGTNLQAWREYAQNGKTDLPEVSIAERISRSLF